MALRDYIQQLGSHRSQGRNLSSEEAYRAFGAILEGGESEIRVATFLTALRWKGVTVEELVGFARAMRDRARLPKADGPGLVAICPPHGGYELQPPLDVAAGLITTAAGARVLIITERCAPPRRGLTAASVLQALGTGLTWDPSEAEAWLKDIGFAGICAVGMLPALLGLRKVAQEIGVRTPLSTVVKLIAPSNAAVLLGARGGPVLGTAVEVIQTLGHPRGMAIQGLEGGVVPTLQKRSRGIHLDGQHQLPITIDPADFGLSGVADAELPLYMPNEEGLGAGDNPALVAAAGEVTQAILAGQHGPARSQAVLTAALALRTAGLVPTLADGLSKAADAIDSGAASAVLERLRAASRLG
jgi:anthranilate phosphoribosyltransferase